MNLEQEDKKLLEEWKQDPSFILRHDKRFWVELPDVKTLLAAQDRLSYQRGVEAERKSVLAALEIVEFDHIANDWKARALFEGAVAGIKNFPVTKPTNEEKQ